MNPPRLKIVLCAALGACIIACEQPSDSARPIRASGAVLGTGSDFDRSVLAIKSAHADPKERIAALDALAARHGRILAPQTSPDPAFEDAESPASQAGSLGKQAAVIRRFGMKSGFFGNDDILGLVVLVKPGQTLTAWTTRPAGSSVDPFLVAMTHDGPRTAQGGYIVKVLGLNDDNPQNGSVDSRVVWKNATGVDQGVHVKAFAYTPSVSGFATLHTQVDALQPKTHAAEMGGIAIFFNNFGSVPNDCTGPLSDRISLQTHEGNAFTYGVLLVNAETMKGGVIYSEQLLKMQVLDLAVGGAPLSPAPNGYPNFLLLHAVGLIGPTRPEVAVYRGMQWQQFSCPN
jgi:hypothetical protein